MKVHLVDTKPLKDAAEKETEDKVTYPLLAFAFNPMALRVDTVNDTSVTIRIWDKAIEDASPIEITRETYDKNVVFDLSAVARSMFDRTKFHLINQNNPYFKDEHLYKELRCEILIGNKTAGEQVTAKKEVDIPVIWGAMQIGETYDQSRNLKMFRGYPFTIPLLVINLNIDADNEEDLPIRVNLYDGEGWGEISFSQGKHYIYIDGDVADTDRMTIWFDNIENDSIHGGFISVFDFTFDYTFRGLSENSFVKHIDILDTCGDDGYYLRWINSHGEYCYWLFKPQMESVKVENQSIEFDQYFTTVNFTENYHVGTNKPVGKKVQKTVQLYADFVDSADYDFLLGLVQSPVVDLYMGKTNDMDKWMSVNIQPATFPKGKEHLQDFSFILELPKKQIQNL